MVGAAGVTTAKKKSWPAALVTIVGARRWKRGCSCRGFAPDVQAGITGWALFSNAKAALGAAGLALLLGLVMLVGARAMALKLLLIVAGGVGIGVAVYDLLRGPDQVNKVGLQRVPAADLNAAFGYGVIVCAAGGGLVLLSGLFSRRRKQAKAT